MPPRASGAGRKPGSNLPAAVPDDQLLKKVPKAPDELMDDNSCLIWKSQARVLIDRKVLTEDLLPLLLAYCNSFSIMLKADAMILKDGLISYGELGEKKHPALNARADAISALVRIGSLLGLDPMSHRRLVGGSNSEGGSGGEWSEFN